MIFADEYRKLIAERKSISDEIDYDDNPVIAESVKLFCEHMDEAILFVKNECTADDIIWLSEILDEIVSRSQNKTFLMAVGQTAEKYPEVVREYNIKYFIDSAEEFFHS